MSDNTLWYGYLDAGDRSSAVAIDNKLSTGEATTVYIFNLKRGEIIEYKRAIVEARLRELKEDEQELIGELKSGYRKARGAFQPRGARAVNVPERGRPAAAKHAATTAETGIEEPYDDGDFVDDDMVEEEDAD